MTPQGLFVAILAVSLANGLLSPFLPVVYALTPAWVPHLFPGIGELAILPEMLFYISALLLSTLTLLVGGVPAALYERLAGGGPTVASMAVWLGGALLLSLPSAIRFAT